MIRDNKVKVKWDYEKPQAKWKKNYKKKIAEWSPGSLFYTILNYVPDRYPKTSQERKDYWKWRAMRYEMEDRLLLHKPLYKGTQTYYV